MKAAELATPERIIEENLAYNVGTDTELSPGERERLAAAVKIIDKGMDTFLAVGTALTIIRDGRLYRETHGTFEEFCKEKWTLSRPRAYELMAAAKVLSNLSVSAMADKPTSERQVRPLTKLPPDQQVEAWEEAVHTAPDGKVTAKHVANVVKKKRRPKFNPDTSGLKLGSQAMHHAETAIMHLKHIQANDPERIKALRRVIRYCKEQIPVDTVAAR